MENALLWRGGGRFFGGLLEIYSQCIAALPFASIPQHRAAKPVAFYAIALPWTAKRSTVGQRVHCVRQV
jgi:hypothetical protein